MSLWRSMGGAAVLCGWGVVAACSGPKTVQTPTHQPGSAASSQAIGFVASSGPSPINVVLDSGSCHLDAQAAVGGSYRYKPEGAGAVVEQLRQSLGSCIKDKNGHGTLHVGATVGSDGTLSAVVVSPGGALSTKVSQCVEAAMMKVKLASPESPDANALLVLVVSECKR